MVNGMLSRASDCNPMVIDVAAYVHIVRDLYEHTGLSQRPGRSIFIHHSPFTFDVSRLFDFPVTDQMLKPAECFGFYIEVGSNIFLGNALQHIWMRVHKIKKTFSRGFT